MSRIFGENLKKKIRTIFLSNCPFLNSDTEFFDCNIPE